MIFIDVCVVGQSIQSLVTKVFDHHLDTRFNLHTLLRDLSQIAMKRGQISVECIAMPLACNALILFMMVYCEFAVANFLFKSPCEANKAYRQNRIGTVTIDMIRTECALLCKKYEACNSFTYNRRSGLCQLSTGMETNCNLLTNEADSQYFTVVSIATPSE